MSKEQKAAEKWVASKWHRHSRQMPAAKFSEMCEAHIAGQKLGEKSGYARGFAEGKVFQRLWDVTVPDKSRRDKQKKVGK